MSLYGDTATSVRPLPDVQDPLTARFWSAARDGRLEFQVCQSCGYVVWPAARRCPQCLADRLEWKQVSGRGSLWSWARYEQALHPAFTREVPYVVAGVQLDAGPFLFSNIIGASPDQLAIGMPLDAVFDEIAPGISLVKFQPAAEGNSR